MPADLGGEVAELLQQLIRNSCVNDGTVASGHEDRSAATIEAVLEGAGLDLQSYEPFPGRRSLSPGSRAADQAHPRSPWLGTPTSCRRSLRNGDTTRSGES